jgi:SAM-dependent methyltransferase
MACLDVGCGGGDVTFEMARMVGPAGRVIGIDIDETKIELARREALELQLSQAEFHVSEVGGGGGSADYDVVYARFVLTHLPDPAGALAWMLAQLRPGGVAVVEDIDFRGHFCEPDSPAFRRYVELYTHAVHRKGADPNIGPRLPGLLRDGGCQNVEMHVVQPAGLDGEVKLIGPITLENIADSVIAEGLASRQELDAVIRALYAFAEDRRSVISLPRIVQAWGTARR